jgi:hypothetical protein
MLMSATLIELCCWCCMLCRPFLLCEVLQLGRGAPGSIKHLCLTGPSLFPALLQQSFCDGACP